LRRIGYVEYQKSTAFNQKSQKRLVELNTPDSATSCNESEK